jgi:threonine/homoserine/homoserine lactone efflux protein
MFEVPPILVAGITGIVSGLLLSIPVGPINLTILNEGAQRGFKWAALIGLGATVMEVIYCFLAFTSFAAFFMQVHVKLAMQLFGFVFMSFIGIRFLLAKSVPGHSRGGRAAPGRRLEERLHPRSAFMIGLVRVMGNVGVLVFWIFLALYFTSHELVTPDWRGKLACVAGVAVGTGGWFVGLSRVVSLGQGKFSEETLLRMEHYSGAFLVLLAFTQGTIVLWQLHAKG